MQSEAQQRLLRSGSKRPVVIISKDKNDGLKDQALKAGAVGSLQNRLMTKIWSI